MTEQTHDLSNGWFLNMREDGSATVRNCDKGQRIDLTQESMETLRKILNKNYRA